MMPADAERELLELREQWREYIEACERRRQLYAWLIDRELQSIATGNAELAEIDALLHQKDAA